MKYFNKVLFIFILIMITVACSNNNNEVEDHLIDMYTKIDSTDSIDDVKKFAKQADLFVNEKETDTKKIIKIAESEEITSFDETNKGDYVQVSFDKDTNDLQISEYFNNNKFITLFYYVDGLYWEFQNTPENEGYYINTYNEKAGDFELEIDGEIIETEYLKVNNKDEQIDFLSDFEREEEK